MMLSLVFTSISVSVILLFLLAVKLNVSVSTGIAGGLIVGAIVILPAYGLIVFFHVSSIFLIILIEACLCLLMTLIYILFRFFRDPQRQIPDEDRIIVSPADGTVRYVLALNKDEIPISEKKGNCYKLHELTKTDVISEGSFLIGIEMSVLDNHVNRAPAAGEIILQKPSKGRFLSLRCIESIFENERVTTIIQNKEMTLCMVQIASRLVRRIVSFHHEKDEVDQGERIGMIRFGSQVDLILPKIDALKPAVKPGQPIKAGETVVARY